MDSSYESLYPSYQISYSDPANTSIATLANGMLTGVSAGDTTYTATIKNTLAQVFVYSVKYSKQQREVSL